MNAVQAVYEASHKIYGYRRITIQLKDQQGLRINHKAVLRLTLAPGASAGVRKQGIRSVVS